MNVKFILIILGTYIFSLFVNFFPALKHPDAEMTLLHFFSSAIFLGALIISYRKLYAILKKYLIIGMFAGIYIFISDIIITKMNENLILDLVTSLMYPLYFIFVTPLFGGNLLLNLSYSLYSIVVSIIYLGIYVILKRRNHLDKS